MSPIARPEITRPAPSRDAALLGRLAAGDPCAADALVAAHQERVMRVCRAVLRDHHDAQDAAQETWMRVFRHIGRFRGEDLGAWLCTIARNEAYRLAVRRAKAPTPVEELPPVRDAAADPLSAAIAADIRQALMGAVMALEETYREVAIRDLAGESPTEIAQVLEMTPGATRVRTHRARKRIQARLEDRLAA